MTSVTVYQEYFYIRHRVSDVFLSNPYVFVLCQSHTLSYVFVRICWKMQHAATFSCSFVETHNTCQIIMVLTKTIGKRSVSISKIMRTFSKMSNIFRKYVTRFGKFRLFLVNSEESAHFLIFSENPDFFITRARNFWILLDFYDLIRYSIVFAHIFLM